MKKVFLLLLSFVTIHVSAYHTPFFSPLYIAAAEGNLQKVKELVSQGANVNAENEADSSVMWGEDWYNEEVGLTPIYGAIFGKNSEVINFLIAHGAGLNTVSTNQYWPDSPLKAAAGNMPEIIETLIHHGAREGYANALYILVTKNVDVELLRKILTYRGKLLDENRNESILSELLLSASFIDRFVDLSIIKLLVALGADVRYSLVEDKGKTALHYIAKTPAYINKIIQNKVEIAQFLLSLGANLHARDQEGKTPFDIAVGISHPEPRIMQVLS